MKNNIQNISVLNLSLSKLYVFKKEITLFGFIIRKSGIFHKFHNEQVYINNMNDITLINNKIYTKPRCIMLMSDRKFHTLYFESYEDAIKFSELNFKNKKCSLNI